MSRNAPLVIPDNLSEADASMMLSKLKDLCLEKRENFYPPAIEDGLVLLDTDIPIWVGTQEDVKSYHLKYKEAFDLAHKFYPQANLFKHANLPAKLKLPKIFYNVTRVSISKNPAKDSISFGSATAVLARCGEFDKKDEKNIIKFFEENPDRRVVCHREFVDFRARMHFFNTITQKPEKDTHITQFYTTGLILAAHDISAFEVVNNIERKIKKYKNAYNNPMADNGTWKIYAKKP